MRRETAGSAFLGGRPSRFHGPAESRRPEPRLLGGREPISQLIQVVRQLKLNEHPKIACLVEKIAVKQDHQAASKLMKRLARVYYEQQLTPNQFISADQNLDGYISIGHTDDNKRIGLTEEELSRHTFVSGQSGMGKTNLLELVFMQAKERGLHAVYYDRKGDLDHAVSSGIDVIHWRQHRGNILCPADCGVSVEEHRNDFVTVFVELMQFQQRGRSVFLLGLDSLYRAFDVYERWPAWDWNTMQFPTLIDLLDVFKSRDFAKRIRGQGAESLLSVVDKLEALLIQLAPIVNCQRGFDITRLWREKRAVSYMLDGLSYDYQNFLIIMDMIRYSHFFRTYGPRNELNCLLIFDEAKGLFGRLCRTALSSRTSCRKSESSGSVSSAPTRYQARSRSSSSRTSRR